jgi:thiamine pyrophosphate-dependent acetolactate synthase large subunit-like protein
VIFGIGCSFTNTSFGQVMPKGKPIIHATLDAADLNKDQECDYALIGDADLTLKGLVEAVKDLLGGKSRGRARGDCRPDRQGARGMAGGVGGKADL